MTFKELELFYHLCEDSHISQLAKNLQMSQSAISLAIKSLENKLQEPLFDRIGKKLVLNERGRFFKEKTYNHFLALKDAQNLFKKDKVSGILQIASSKTIGDFVIPQIIYDFLSDFSNTKVSKDIKNSSKIVSMVLNGDIDIGFIESQSHELNIIKEQVASDRLIVVSGDKKLSFKEFYIDQLFSKKWLLREPGSGTRELFLNALGGLSKELEIFMEFSEFEEMKTLLANNPDALSCVSKIVVEKELQRKELFELKLKNISLERKLYMIYHKNKYKSALFETFASFAKSRFKNLSVCDN